MQVILLEKVGKFGGLGDLIEVKSGFARNFLFPNNKALRATPENIERFTAQRAEVERLNMEKIADAEKLATKVNDTNLIFIKQAGDDGRLYGSISAKDIAAKLEAEVGVPVHASAVRVGSRLKDMGVYQITVELHPEVMAYVNVNISRSEEEAKAAFEKKAKAELISDESNRK